MELLSHLKKYYLLRLVMRKTKWKKQYADTMMKAAKQKGITHENYVNYECWSLDGSQIEVLGKILSGKNRTLHKYADKLCAVKNIGKGKAIVDLCIGSKKFNISYRTYINYKCYLLNDKELELLGRILGKKNTILHKYADKVCELSDEGKGKALVKLLMCKKEHGIPYSRYIYNECWTFTDEELVKLGDALKKLKEKRSKNKEWYADLVCEKVSTIGGGTLQGLKLKIN